MEQQAKQGDWRARGFLADYLLIKAAQALTLTHGVDDDLRAFMRELVGLGDTDDEEVEVSGQ